MLNMLGVRPCLGRDFSSDEGVLRARPRGADQSRTLDRAFRRSDRNIVGHAITLNFESYAIIGVLPPRFRTPEFGFAESPKLLVPLTFTGAELQNRGNHINQVFARVRAESRLRSNAGGNE